MDALIELASQADTDVFVNALVGAAGMQPTLKAIERGKKIALANKETLVIAGELVMNRARQKGVPILPIDSEHSAILQCLVGERTRSVQRLILTASGGPFWQRPAETFDEITLEEALNHPNWSMGQKITIDSATMMNKGLELIEARWLFDMLPDAIDVIVHPQSIVHSMVEFNDGSVKAQLGVPDMKIPIQYALTYPERELLPSERLDFEKLGKLSFYPPDNKKFRALVLAREALRVGGTATAVLNGANEQAVELFLNRKIAFKQIPESIEAALEKHSVKSNPSIDDVLGADRWSREFVKAHVGKF